VDFLGGKDRWRRCAEGAAGFETRNGTLLEGTFRSGSYVGSCAVWCTRDSARV